MLRIENRKARHEYEIIERYEAGIELKGSEIKSIVNGNVSLQGSYCKFINNELFIIGMHIARYPNAMEKLDEKRDRKLLLHKSELKSLFGKLTQKGFTIIPLCLYFNSRGKVKIEIGLCKGKKKYERKRKEKFIEEEFYYA